MALAVWPAALLITVLAWRLSAAYRTVILVVVAILWGMQTFERPRDWRSFEALVDADFRAYPGYYMPAAYKITSFQLPQGLYGEAAQTAKRITSPEFRDVMSRMVGIHYLIHAGPAEDGKLREAMAQLWSLGNDIRLPPAQAQWNSPVKNLWIKLPYLLAAEWKVLDERYSGDTSVRYNAGMWMLDVHRYRDAAAYLDSAATSDDLPRNLRGVTLSSLGLALVKLGRTAEAEASLRAALEQSPPDPLAHCKLLDIYVQTNRPVEARAADAGCRNARAR
jgi:tetratricopeptide (TPR) repeat protein